MSTSLNQGGPVTLVTGGTRGVGRAIAERLARAGHRLMLNYAGNAAAADAARTAVEALGGEALTLAGDVASATDVEALFQAAQARFGRVDHVVVNAGIELIDTPIVDIKPEAFDRLLAVNARGAFLTMQAAARHLPDGGRIVQIGSTTTLFPHAGFTAYAASKAVGRMLVDVLAKELGPRGITVNSVIPGPLSDAGVLLDAPLDAKQWMASLSPLARMGTSHDAAGAVAFLLSPEAGFVSGHHLVVNGAATI
ncbi:hypothetical protein IP84_02355 [beta proteobacterium AAP99]|nr:hypothetical protein IP84_02355 [beta proteobacterium AAP99]